jgi:hypothetical protein
VPGSQLLEVTRALLERVRVHLHSGRRWRELHPLRGRRGGRQGGQDNEQDRDHGVPPTPRKSGGA